MTSKTTSLTMKMSYIHQIRAHEKTVEGRINERGVKTIREGDIVRFYYYCRPSDDVYCRIVSVEKFPSFEAMLLAKGIDACLPHVHTISEAVAAYAKIPKYTEKAKKHGVVALGLLRIKKGA